MVIVPTRELVQQVREVFDMCVRKTKLKVLSFLKSFLTENRWNQRKDKGILRRNRRK